MRQDVRTAVLERKLSGLKRLSDPEDQSRDSETGNGQVLRKKVVRSTKTFTMS